MLKNVLPEMKNLLHDTSEMVRVKFMEILLKVKRIKTIKVRVRAKWPRNPTFTLLVSHLIWKLIILVGHMFGGSAFYTHNSGGASLRTSNLCTP